MYYYFRIKQILSMIDAYKLFWTKAFDFNGVSTRSEFWYSYLANIIIYLLLNILTGIGMAINEWLGGLIGIVLLLFSLGIIIPSISVSVRRTNDAGKAWSWIFINLVPLGGFYYIYLLCQPSLPIS